MINLEHKIVAYTFDELSSDAKEVAKGKILEIDRDPMIFSGDLIDFLECEYGLNNLKTYYSLSYCQGDGLCLYGNIYDNELFDNEKFSKIAFKGIHWKQKEGLRSVLSGITFTHHGRYYHERSVTIDSDSYNASDKQYVVIDKIVENIEKWYFEFCNEWKGIGYDYFYEITDEDASYFCNDNDILFHENGKKVSGEYCIAS